MSEITPLTVTLELPASEFLDHEGSLLVRCPLNGAWVPLKDYYSENQNSLLPLVGNVDYEDAPEHWEHTGEFKEIKDRDGVVVDKEPLMAKVAKQPVVWKETIRILPKAEEAPPEGGTLSFAVQDSVAMKDKF